MRSTAAPAIVDLSGDLSGDLAVAGGPVFALTMVVATVRCLLGAPPAWVAGPTLARSIRRWGAASGALAVAVIVASVASGRGADLMLWWLGPVTLFLLGPFTWMTMFEHRGAARDVSILESSGTVTSNAVFRRVLLNGNYHLAHHVLPTASWWNLGAVDAEVLRWRQQQPDAAEKPTANLRHSGFVDFHRRLWADLPWRS